MTPIVTNISPAVGATGGFAIVEITGSNFRLPTSAPHYGSGVTPPPPPSVLVTFGGVAARLVRVASATRLIVTTPDHDPGVVDVVVTNVDDFGASLGSSTTVGGFEFAYPSFTKESDLVLVLVALIVSLRRWILPNVVYTQHVDMDDDPLDAMRKVADVKLPLMFLTGPTLRANGFFRQNVDPNTDQVDGSQIEHRLPKTYDAVFGAVVAMDSAKVTLEMLNAAITSLNRNPWLNVNMGDRGVFSYEMEIEGDPTTDSRATRSSVYSASFSIVVRGVDVVGLPGFVNDMTTTIRPLIEEHLELSAEQAFSTEDLTRDYLTMDGDYLTMDGELLYI